MEEKIITLQRDVELHKQMETELAKRSHQCQGVIKKYTDKVKEAEDKLQAVRARSKCKIDKIEGIKVSPD